jgi:dihydrolipoamide dehydrogenase
MNFDVVIIGSGPGGYVCAIRCAQLGLKTAVVEKDKTFGGTCLNVGCIPSKALLQSSEHFASALHDLDSHGIKIKNVELDLGTMMGRKEKIVKDLTQGIAFLFKKNKIESFKGFGKVTGPSTVSVNSEGNPEQILSAKYIILASGSIPSELPFLKVDEKKIVSSTGALALTDVPKRLVVIGGGVIGLELGSVWMRLGSEVTVIEFAARIGGSLDAGVSQSLKKILEKQGMKFIMQTKVVGADLLAVPSKKSAKDPITLHYESTLTEGPDAGKKNSIEADVVLVSVGRKPYSEGLGIKELGIEQDRMGRVVVNSYFQTNIPSIYAIGDLIAGPMLAHKAEDEGVALAEILGTGHGHVNYNTVPGVVYTWPEVATVGLTEEQLKEQNIPYKVGTFPFMANGRAKALACTEGSVKILAHAQSDKILGCHIIGPNASELIHEVVVAMEFSGSSEDLARSFHAHPTLSEVVREAALAVDKRARQM